MQKPLLFLETKKEWGVAFLLLLFCSGIILAWKFYIFSEYMQKGKQSFQAKIINQYYKNDKWVLKLKNNNGLILYITSKEHLKDLQNRDLRVFGKPASCTFFQSLKSCFFIAFSFNLLPKDYRFFFYDFIDSQHQDKLLSQFYQTLFFATALPFKWRELASTLKISHLLAISGLHLGILLGVFYFFLSPLYRFFQSRFFTYRNALFDLSFLASLSLLAYLFLLDFPPSFLRAYMMSVVGLVFFYFHLSLLNFSFLLLCSCLILALFPQYIFSLGFWFSVSGVFYIFLFFKHFNFSFLQNRWLKAFLVLCLLNFVLFFNMLPLTHWFFPVFSFASFLSIPLSIVFAPFFILALTLHLCKMGGVFDDFLLKVLNLDIQTSQISTPSFFAIFYLLVSFLSLKSRIAYVLCLGLGVVFSLFLVWKAF